MHPRVLCIIAACFSITLAQRSARGTGARRGQAGTRLVCILHRGQAVRDDHHRAPLHQLLDGRLHQPLVLGVQRGGGLVQDEDGRVLRRWGPGVGGSAARRTAAAWQCGSCCGPPACCRGRGGLGRCPGRQGAHASIALRGRRQVEARRRHRFASPALSYTGARMLLPSQRLGVATNCTENGVPSAASP